MAFSWFEFLAQYNGLIWQGFLMTLRVCAIAMFAGFFLGIFAALLKLSSKRIVRTVASFYVEIFRGTPLLVQILFMSFAYPFLIRDVFGVPIVYGNWTNPTELWDVIIILALNTGAYQAEIIRAGILSIPKGQMEAARSLGFTYPQAMRHIILPQTFRVILPPLSNEFLNLILNSSLVSVVAVKDLTFFAKNIASQSFRTLETWFTIGGIYLVITTILARVFKRMEKKYRIPGLGIN